MRRPRVPRPHEEPTFTNSVTYTVSITYTVRGGARHGTADRHALRIAEQLANAAARFAWVVEVSGTTGRSWRGEVSQPKRLHFAAANTGAADRAEPRKLDRYLDPDHERALRSLEDANAAYREQQAADHQRRTAVGCRNVDALWAREQCCTCVYCEPGHHYAAIEAERVDPGNPMIEHRCVCGQPVAAYGDRCLAHQGATVCALRGDDRALHQLAAAVNPGRLSLSEPGREAVVHRDSGRSQGQGLDF